jgi:hypothetical protein
VAPRIAAWHRAAVGSEGRAEPTPEALARRGVRPGTTSVVVGASLAVLAEFIASCLPGRADAHALTGVAIGLILLGMRISNRVANSLV